MYNARKIWESNRFKPETGNIRRLRFILIRKKTHQNPLECSKNVPNPKCKPVDALE